ncbi:MAG: hypothetical protein IBJ10_09025, partial [Phycisphaerales bacterium]|nr:hypothetical protein [Phycisphaerales bacterium]
GWNTLKHLTPQKVQTFVYDYICGLRLDQLASAFGLTFRQVAQILEHPEVKAEIDAALEVAAQRHERMVEVALAEAVEVLLQTVRDLTIPAETRRKAAGQIIRLHKDLRKQAATSPKPAENTGRAPAGLPEAPATIAPTPSVQVPRESSPRNRKERRAAQRLEHQRAPIPQPVAA